MAKPSTALLERSFSALSHLRCQRKSRPMKISILGTTGFSRARRDRAGHYKDLTENGKRARKVTGTQGRKLGAMVA